MSVTTLEEVFLRVANGTADVAARKNLAGISIQRQSSQSSTMMQAETAKVCFLCALCRVSVGERRSFFLGGGLVLHRGLVIDDWLVYTDWGMLIGLVLH